MKHAFLYFIVLSSLVFGCSREPEDNPQAIDLPFYVSSDLTPHWVAPDSSIYPYLHSIAPFSLTDQEGHTVSNRHMEGKVVIVNFFFTICPGICPKMNANLKAVQEAFDPEDEVMILSHSVMPWVDSVAQLKQYAVRNEIDHARWKLLTGSKETIYALARNAYFADEGFGKTVTSSEDFLHTEKVLLLDQRQRLRGVYNGTLPLDMKRMIADARQLLQAKD